MRQKTAFDCLNRVFCSRPYVAVSRCTRWLEHPIVKSMILLLTPSRLPATDMTLVYTGPGPGGRYSGSQQGDSRAAN